MDGTPPPALSLDAVVGGNVKRLRRQREMTAEELALSLTGYRRKRYTRYTVADLEGRLRDQDQPTGDIYEQILQRDRHARGDQPQEGPDLRQSVDPDGDDEDCGERQGEVGERLPPPVLHHTAVDGPDNEQPPDPADEPSA